MEVRVVTGDLAVTKQFHLGQQGGVLQ